MQGRLSRSVPGVGPAVVGESECIEDVVAAGSAAAVGGLE